MNNKKEFKEAFKKRIYNFVLNLIKFIDKLPKDSVCNVMGKQLLRSGTSILANYIEVQATSSKKDFTNFFYHSLKSANESKVWLALLKDSNKSKKEETEKLLIELKEIANILATSILTLKGKK